MSNLFSRCFPHLGFSLQKYAPDSGKVRTVFLSTGESLAPEKFQAKLKSKLADIGKHLEKEDFIALDDFQKFLEVLQEYAEEKGVLQLRKPLEVPEEYNGLTLNVDPASPGRELQYYLTNEKDILHPMSAWLFIRRMGMNEDEALAGARELYRVYLPRSPNGVTKAEIGNFEVDALNTYVPPVWKNHKTGGIKDQLPSLFKKLVEHVFPIEEEREYFFHFVHASLFSRAPVYLVLCGAPGVGKNTIKMVLRALHGSLNTVDGKKSSLVERFNSQLADCTLLWFDELHYTHEMENVMKEIPNETASIERKGVDATKSDRIYASMVISNNKPRDNYIAFDARKFVPLVLNTERLETSMEPEEIDTLIKKVNDPTKPEFDPAFITQIALWIKKHGRSPKWPNLEYRGPMFYRLAHTSMSRWQKLAAEAVMAAYQEKPAPDLQKALNAGGKRGLLWSEVEAFIRKKYKSDRTSWPEYTTVRDFFDKFLDAAGKKSFKTSDLQKQGNLLNDFYVKLTNENVGVYTESGITKLGDIVHEEEKSEDDPTDEEERKADRKKKKSKPVRRGRDSDEDEEDYDGLLDCF